MNAEVLNSWKEIAAYMGRGVRTVQRWEQELGLPVRRPRGKERSAVIALKPDLDRWLHKVPQGSPAEGESHTQQHERLHANTDLLARRIQMMIERSAHMQETVKSTIELTAKLREQQSKRMRKRAAVSDTQSLLVRRTLDLSTRVMKNAGGKP